MNTKKSTSITESGQLFRAVAQCVVKLNEERSEYLSVHGYKRMRESWSFLNPSDVCLFLEKEFDAKNLAQEHTWLICMNNAGEIKGVFEMTVGTATYALINVREIFRNALLCGATRIIFAHNHPCGNPNPSDEDVRITRRIQDAARLLDIVFCDHIIVGAGDYYSFRSNHII